MKTIMRYNLQRFLLASATTIALFAATNGRANLLAYEGWDYTAGGTFVGGNGGLGWNAGWIANGSANSGNIIALSGSLTYNDGFGNTLAVSGNRGFITADGSATGDNIVGGTAAQSTPGRALSFSRGTSGLTESTWISLLALRTGIPNPTPGAAPNDYLYGRATQPAGFFYNATPTSTTVGNEHLVVGRATQSTETTHPEWANDTWALVQQGTALASKVSNVNMAAPPADFLLIRIDHIGSTVNDAANADTARLWINPRLDVVPSDASADVVFNASEYAAGGAAPANTTRDFIFNRIRLFAGNAQTTPSGRSYGSVEMDELRIGETFADVTPIPEPSVAVFSGLAVLMLFRRRK